MRSHAPREKESTDMARRTLISAFTFILLFSAAASAQKPAMDTVLYGASYYHEYMPYDRLEQDVELMQKAGITVVRLGESTWSSWEPREGEFQFAWMERIINRLHQAGLKVILGTPTYSIPPWLYRKYPEILVTKLGGEKEFYGPRQNMDITHPTYLYYAERVIRQVVSHFKDHPAVIGYQIDNETSSYGTAGRNVQLSFVDYLKKKFGSTQRLNDLWGLVYWGQLVNDWDELPPRDGILNPGYKLEWERYQQKITTDFLAWQAAIVSEYKRPDQFITHNFVGGVRTNINEYEIAKHLDIAAVNPYHPVQDQLRPWGTSLSGDVVRSLKHTNYLITETNAQTIGWDSKGQFPPYDGQIRLNVYSHVANGANMVAYWHWHSLHYGQETYWKGVFSHDLEPNRVYNEVSRTAHELKKIGPRLVNFQRKNRAAILYSIDSYQGIRFMPFSDDVDYMTVLHQLHRSFERLKMGVDFVFPESNNFADYDVIVVPPLYVASDALLERLVDFVKGGGHLVMSFKSGFCNEYSTVRWTRMPALLREAAGFSYQEFSNLREPLALKGDPFGVGDKNRVSAWAEMLMPESAKVLATYDHPFFGRFAAITRNQYGKGTLTYEGTYLSDELQKQVLLGVLQLAHLTGPDQELPQAVTVRHGTDNSGKTMHFYLNYSSDAQKFAYTYGDGVEMLSEGSVRKGQTLTLAPWDVAIIEER
jgi:beta-galactosidase